MLQRQRHRKDRTVNEIAIETILKAILEQYVIEPQSVYSIIDSLSTADAMFLINHVWSWPYINDVITQCGSNMMCMALGRSRGDNKKECRPGVLRRPDASRVVHHKDVPWASIVPSQDRTHALHALLKHIFQKTGRVHDKSALSQWVRQITSSDVANCVHVLVSPEYGQQWLTDWNSNREWQRSLAMKQRAYLRQYGAIIWHQRKPRFWQCTPIAERGHHILHGTITIEYDRHTPTRQISVRIVQHRHTMWYESGRFIVPVVEVESPDTLRIRTLMLCLNHRGFAYTPDVLITGVKKYLYKADSCSILGPIYRPPQYKRMKKMAIEQRHLSEVCQSTQAQTMQSLPNDDVIDASSDPVVLLSNLLDQISPPVYKRRRY